MEGSSRRDEVTIEELGCPAQVLEPSRVALLYNKTLSVEHRISEVLLQVDDVSQRIPQSLK